MAAAPRHFSPVPDTQALTSKTFRIPPLDGSMMLPEMLDWHLEKSPNHRLIVYPTDHGSRTITWREGVKAIHRGVRILRHRFSWKPEDDALVAILASADNVPYFFNNMAVIRAGYTLFTISSRNSPAAVAHLITKVGVKYVLVGREPAMANLVTETSKVLKSEYSSFPEPEFSSLPTFEELFADDPTELEPPPFGRVKPDDLVLYCHSSGSTAFPKPIPWTHLRMLQLLTVSAFGEVDLANKVVALHSMPLYHTMGILMSSASAACGVVISGFQPQYPPRLPSADNVFAASVATESDYIIVATSFLEAWGKKPEYVKWLATRGGIIFGGGPLDPVTGEYLFSQGVTMLSLYGTSEIGAITCTVPAKNDVGWEYFKFSSDLEFKMLPHGDNKFELIVMPNEYRHLQVVNTKVMDIDGYATSDLLIPHPQKPGYWKMHGRTDEQIMHSTGEKTNPGPLERILNQDPHVASSVMFGRGYFQAGVLVDPKPQYKFDPEDEAALADFRNLIWPTIQRMNAFAPQHSRLFKE
ncbi:hypothetical protein AX17_003937, partial [Amanita inopinata Kibby_2008]